MSVLYILLSLLGLGFLIFIHELGHYYMAKRVGMRVETFSIGVGKPLYSWEYDGTTWQIGWLLFGGYVKIAGTDTKKDEDPYEAEDGFFGKSPWQRILVAVMGPVVNLVFALLAFTVLWMIGGREQNFSLHTHKIGWVDHHSQLYQEGVRPGDEITAYGELPYTGLKDHLYAPLISDHQIKVLGNQVDYFEGNKTPFSYTVDVYPHPKAAHKGIVTSGILNAANYLIYQSQPDSDGVEGLPSYSPMANSGIKPGERIVWADGLLLFSAQQLEHVLNDNKALLTVEHNGKPELRRVARIPLGELKLNSNLKAELSDWQFEADLQGQRISQLWFVPYMLANDGTVEERLHFIDEEAEEEAFPSVLDSPIEQPLVQGDRIIAVDGSPTSDSWQILNALQSRRIHIIVDESKQQPVNWLEADKQFDSSIDISAINELAQQMGSQQPPVSIGHFRLLDPVTAITRQKYFTLAGKEKQYKQLVSQRKQQIEAIQNPEERTEKMQQLQDELKQRFLGIPVQDNKVKYNPNPFQMFGLVFNEIWNTLSALFSGTLSVDWIRGPVGIIEVVHQQTAGQLREAIYWLGMISLNLGMLNLLPIPVLDGGTIMFSLFEIITRRRISSKVMEWLVLPFALLLIGLLVYITFNDVLRIFRGLWGG